MTNVVIIIIIIIILIITIIKIIKRNKLEPKLLNLYQISDFWRQRPRQEEQRDRRRELRG